MSINFWYKPFSFFTYLLLPFSFIFRGVIEIRHLLYKIGLKKVFHFHIPIIVVGNISVGGTGKTPLIIWLANVLSELGLHPAIISRGFGVKKIKKPRLVKKDSDVLQVGDEPLLIAQHVDCPIVVCVDRIAAIDFLLQNFYCNVILSDDGLQYYRMNRDVEIVVIDAKRGIGNGHCLPAGPLREPVSRLSTVDFIVYNDLNTVLHQDKLFNMRLKPGKLTSVVDFERQVELEDVRNRVIHAVCGIGNADRFFNTLKGLGLNIIEHPFSDHYLFEFSDINFEQESIVIMTEKDAVKCQRFADSRHWFLPVTAQLDRAFVYEVMKLVKGEEMM